MLERSLIFFLPISRFETTNDKWSRDSITRDKDYRVKKRNSTIPFRSPKNKRKEWTPPSTLRREKGGSTIRMVKVLRRRGRSGGAHIEGREGAACPDTLCPDNDDDGDDHDGHDVAEVPVPFWIPLSVRRWVHCSCCYIFSISVWPRFIHWHRASVQQVVFFTFSSFSFFFFFFWRIDRKKVETFELTKIWRSWSLNLDGSCEFKLNWRRVQVGSKMLCNVSRSMFDEFGLRSG